MSSSPDAWRSDERDLIDLLPRGRVQWYGVNAEYLASQIDRHSLSTRDWVPVHHSVRRVLREMEYPQCRRYVESTVPLKVRECGNGKVGPGYWGAYTKGFNIHSEGSNVRPNGQCKVCGRMVMFLRHRKKRSKK